MITAGPYRAVTTEVGAGLRVLTFAGAPLIDGYSETEPCAAAHGQVLLPWPNRVADGRYEFAGQHQQLALTQPSEGHAIHGLARWANWSLHGRTPESARWGLRLHPQPGYPHVRALANPNPVHLAAGLAVHLEVRNEGAGPAPFGAGFHPYLTAGSPLVDTDVLTLEAGSVLRSDDRAIPVGAVGVDEAGLDFRGGRRLDTTVLDHAFGDLAPAADGRVRVTLAGSDRSTTLWADPAFRWVQLFTGDGLGPERARHALAVEPMTCPPNALASGADLRVLAPGEVFSASWGIVSS